MSGAGLLAGLTIPRLIKPTEVKSIRPPGSVEPGLYNILCSRCGNCIKACPTNIIIPYSDFDKPFSWMTPAISFRSGYCLETCNLCGKVCPTGAITLFSIEAKRSLYMGTARITTANCYLSNNRECIKCREACKYDAVEFLPESNLLNILPSVDSQKCVGCGACEVVCPAGCIMVSNPVQKEMPQRH
jgi:ferredoxin-type protein NapF